MCESVPARLRAGVGDAGRAAGCDEGGRSRGERVPRLALRSCDGPVWYCGAERDVRPDIDGGADDRPGGTGPRGGGEIGAAPLGAARKCGAPHWRGLPGDREPRLSKDGAGGRSRPWPRSCTDPASATRAGCNRKPRDETFLPGRRRRVVAAGDSALLVPLHRGLDRLPERLSGFFRDCRWVGIPVGPTSQGWKAARPLSGSTAGRPGIQSEMTFVHSNVIDR
jgi:hypothetical protein